MNDRHDDQARLDELLERARAVDIPETLADDTKRALTAERVDARLDGLLERVPAPEVPAGLSGRVLSGLAARERSEHRPRGRRLAVFLAAAALLLTLGVFVASRGGDERTLPGTELARHEPERELLEALDALENWELLTGEDVDLLLAGLDVADLTLLELAAEEAGDSAEPDAAPDATHENGGTKKG